MYKFKWKLFSIIAFMFVMNLQFAQSMELNMPATATLRQFIQQVESKSGYTFMLDQSIDQSQTVTVDAKEKNIKNILAKAFAGKDISYRIVGKQIILKKSDNVAEKQERKKVSGTVTNLAGEPIIGASVVQKGTSNGTVTDMDGKFSLNISEGSYMQVSYVGYVTKSVKIGKSSNVKIVIQEDAESLNELVVVGYGTQKKASLTGSVATLKSDKLTVAPVSTVTNTLGGQVPGIIARQASGEPGNDAASISIRGFGNALVIVDGVESSLGNLDPNEIESVSVLKDASAAIYGARAGNGVILVTTKRGKSGKMTVSLNSAFSWQSVTRFPSVMDAGQFSEMIREMQTNSGTPESGMMFTEEDVQKYKEGTDPAYKSYSWYDACLKDWAPMQQTNVSLSGGNDDLRYGAFLGYMDQYGMYRSRDNRLQRYNIRANVDGNVNKNLSVSFDLASIVSDINSPTRGQVSLWGDLFGSRPNLRPTLPDPTKVAWNGGITSPIAGTTTEYGGYNKGLNNQLNLTFSTTYKIPFVDGLSFKGLVNYTQSTNESKGWGKGYIMYLYDENSDKYVAHPSAMQTGLGESYSRSKTITGQVSFNYNRTFNEKHTISAMGMVEMIDYYSKWFNAGRSGYITDAIDQLFAGGADKQSANGSASESGRLSYIGRVDYSYEGKYLAEVTARYDGSPNFPDNGRWGFFPSASLAWRMSEEHFMKDNFAWLDNLKLRTSYCTAGYDAVGAYQYLTGYKYGNLYIVDETEHTSLVSTGLANKNITWENMKIYNIGLDFSILKGKLYGEMDWFYRDRTKMLGQRSSSLPNTFGASLPSENINSMSNRGVELMLGHRSSFHGLDIDVSGNITWARAKWNHYDEPEYTDPDDIRIHKVSGNWANRTFGYKSDGLFTSEEEIKNYTLDQDLQGNKTIQPGDIKYIDQNNDGKLDWRDNVLIGKSSDPEIMFGMNVALRYKGFDLSALLQGAAEREMSVQTGISNLNNGSTLIYNERWNENNNDKWAIIPRQYLGGKTNNSYASDYWIKDASYVRLKTFSIGYNLPSSLLQKFSILNLRIYVAGTNLLTFSGLNKYDVDPEGQGVGNYYPQQKVVSIGVNLKF